MASARLALTLCLVFACGSSIVRGFEGDGFVPRVELVEADAVALSNSYGEGQTRMLQAYPASVDLSLVLETSTRELCWQFNSDGTRELYRQGYQATASLAATACSIPQEEINSGRFIKRLSIRCKGGRTKPKRIRIEAKSIRLATEAETTCFENKMQQYDADGTLGCQIKNFVGASSAWVPRNTKC